MNAIQKFFFNTLLLGLYWCRSLAQEGSQDRLQEISLAKEGYDRDLYAVSAGILGQKSLSRAPKWEQELDPWEENELFYVALSELKLANRSAEQQVIHLRQLYPYNAVSQTASFELGNYFFAKGDYKASARCLLEGTSAGFTEERQEYNFKLGYSYLKLQKYEQAKPLLMKATNTGRYKEDALFFYGALLYRQHEYDSAMVQFNKLGSSYSSLAPVFITQISIIRGNLPSARSTAESALEGSGKYRPLLEKELGVVSFVEAKYPEAVLHYEAFNRSAFATQLTDQDRYQLGYSYYQVKQYSKAQKILGEFVDLQSVYAQNGLYALGMSYLKQLKLNEAKSAFELAAGMSFSNEVVENAQYAVIRLASDLGNSAQALSSATLFLAKFKQSGYTSDVKTILATLLLQSRDYKNAYELIQGTSLKNERSAQAFQKIAYFYSLEKINAGEWKAAQKLLYEAAAHPLDQELTKLTDFWLGEASFELKEYAEAAYRYQEYLKSKSQRNAQLTGYAEYGAGYTYFRMKDYQSARESFERSQRSALDKETRSDALQRIADCWLVQKNYEKAKSAYKASDALTSEGSDYSAFQIGVILGLQGRQSEKILTLQALLSKHTSSAYAPEAQFEIANSLFLQSQPGPAAQQFKNVISGYPGTSAAAKSTLKLGLIAFNANDDQEALRYYKEVISKFPGSPESKDALVAVKNIYVERGDMNGYLNYVAAGGLTPVSLTERDSIAYQSAAGRYLRGDFNASITAFDEYLKQFPLGNFAENAHYYRSQACWKLKRPEDAKNDYTFLLEKGSSDAYAETASEQLSSLYVSAGQCSLALPLLQRLSIRSKSRESRSGAVRQLAQCYVASGRLDSARTYAEQLIKISASSTDLSFAQLTLAKSRLAERDTSASLRYFAQASKARDVSAAESRYLTGLVLYKKREYGASIKVIFALSSQLPNFEYWVAKAFVVLAGDYKAQGDTFQAKSTLRSIIKNYKPDDEVKEEARKALSLL